MKNKVSKLSLLVIGGVIVLLLFTNPSNKLYTEYLKANRFELDPYTLEEYSDYEFKPSWGIKYNYLIFTTFKYNNGKPRVVFDRKLKHNIEFQTIVNHIGILSNFYELKPTLNKK